MRLPVRARLLDIQAQQVEVGRIRLGATETRNKRGGGTYQAPVKLERFRLTSRSETLIRTAAAVYGGEPEPWEPQSGGAQQWQVVIEATTIAVIVPPEACSQFYESWANARCTRRCDGARELIEDIPCVCGPDPAQKKARGCKPTTRVSLMLADLPGVGVWRLESHGYHAAAELPAVVDLLSAAGGNLPARLEMEERSAEVPDPRDSNKTVISRFMVPVLHVEATPAAIIGTIARPSLPAGPDPGGEEPAVQGGSGREVAAVGAGVHAPAALPSAPPAPIPAPADDQEHMAMQWKLHAWFEEKIMAAPQSDMQGWADRLRREPRLDPRFRDNLLGIVAHRVDQQAASVAPPPAGDAPPVPMPASGGNGGAPPRTWTEETEQYTVDRAEVWNRVGAVAAAKGHTMTKLKSMFGEFSGDGTTLAAATGDQLQQFLGWMEHNPR